MLGSVLAMFTGLSWGFGVFYSGKASRKMSAPLLTAIYNLVGFIFFTCAFVISEEQSALADSANSVLLKTILAGVLGGIGFSIGIVVCSKGLSNGRAGVIGPLLATSSIIIPFIYTSITSAVPESVAITGIIILLFVPWLVSKTNMTPAHVDTSVTRDSLFGIISGSGFALYYIAIIFTPTEGQYLMLAIVQAVSGFILFSTHIIQKNSWSIPKEIRSFAVAFIALELAGAILLRSAYNHGTASTVTTMAAIFDPIGLLLISRVLNKEIFSKYQLAGFALVVLGIVLVVPNS